MYLGTSNLPDNFKLDATNRPIYSRPDGVLTSKDKAELRAMIAEEVRKTLDEQNRRVVTENRLIINEPDYTIIACLTCGLPVASYITATRHLHPSRMEQLQAWLVSRKSCTCKKETQPHA